MIKLEKITETISTLFLVLSGLSSLIIGIADFTGWENRLLSTTKDPISIVLVAIGILSLSIGIERVARFRNLDRQLQSFEKILAGAVGSQHLVGYEEVYGNSIRLVSTAQNRIRTLVVGKSTKAPKEWAEAVARRLRETQKAGTPIKFEATLAVDFDHIPEDFIDGVVSRLKLYEKFGVKDLVSVNILNLKPIIAFDMFIVDRNHATIGVTTLAGVSDLQRAILFENQPSIASEFADWYDQFILRSAISLDQWLTDIGRK